jgi:hypothetical protein
MTTKPEYGNIMLGGNPYSTSARIIRRHSHTLTPVGAAVAPGTLRAFDLADFRPGGLMRGAQGLLDLIDQHPEAALCYSVRLRRAGNGWDVVAWKLTEKTGTGELRVLGSWAHTRFPTARRWLTT